MASEYYDTEKNQLLATRISFFGSVILFLISAVIGITIDSITLILDASGSLVIIGTALLMHAAIRKMRLPADEFYNFGYTKFEPMTVAMQTGLIIVTCVVSIKFAIQDIIHAEDIKNYDLAVMGTFVSGMIGIFVATYLRFIASRSGSAMLKTASLHWMLDTFMSFGVCIGFFFGIVLKHLGYSNITPYIDPVMAIILALAFMRMPFKEMTHNMLELLDAAPEHDIRAKVKNIVEQYKPKSLGVHRLRIRKAGQRIFVDVCFMVNPSLSVAEADNIAQGFERDLKIHLPHSDVVVHFKV